MRCLMSFAMTATMMMAASAMLGSNSKNVLGWTSHRQQPMKHSFRLHSAILSQERGQSEEQQQQQHPHSKLWSSTLETSPNSYVNPCIKLAIRPPSEGGTGIVAVEDVPANTVALCLPLEEVGMIDAASILDSYNEEEGGDEVLTMLKEMWCKELAATNKGNSEEGKRLAVLAGIIAHLQLTRYKDKNSWTSNSIKEGYALEQSRHIGQFLDAMPLLPQPNGQLHPFPTHFLYWTEDEIQTLLQGTMGQTRAREVRAGIGLVVREWSSSFLKEHSVGATQTQILNAIFSSFTAVLSRSFGDAAGRDLDGKGRMLVPLVDMLNHDGEDPNVSWTWHVGEGDEEKIAEGKGDISVSTLRDIKKGEELFKCYGWRPAWDIASSYGFVPELKKERWECAIIPLLPAKLDLAPDAIPTPSQKAKDQTSLDLLLEANYGPLVKAVISAVDAASEVEARTKGKEDTKGTDDDRPDQLNRLEIVSLFRPPPRSTSKDFAFPRRQPCVVAGTKIQTSNCDTDNSQRHRQAIEAILPAFRASASAISQLRKNHRNSQSDDDSSPIEASQMAMAAASLDQETDWDSLALDLIEKGISDRIQALIDGGSAAEVWINQQNDIRGAEDQARDHRTFRAGVARDVRESELNVLFALQQSVVAWSAKDSIR
ncbi:hypothetical protein ACHAWF_011633 [Thalassiosira exigua]